MRILLFERSLLHSSAFNPASCNPTIALDRGLQYSFQLACWPRFPDRPFPRITVFFCFSASFLLFAHCFTFIVTHSGFYWKGWDCIQYTLKILLLTWAGTIRWRKRFFVLAPKHIFKILGDTQITSKALSDNDTSFCFFFFVILPSCEDMTSLS